MRQNPYDFTFYTVSKAAKAPLLDFLVAGLTEGGCEIIYCSDPSYAPFIIVFETPSAERMGIVCYAFLANHRVIKKRPTDEYRLQAKLGSKVNNVPEYIKMLEDETGLITTLYVGIDTEEGYLVGLDPVLNNNTQLFKMIGYKRHHVDAIKEAGFFAWERPLRDEGEDRFQVLVGATHARLLDYIRFERAARGLDQGNRHFLADEYAQNPPPLLATPTPAQHAFITEMGLEGDALLDLIANTMRIKMAVRGGVAEKHLEELLRQVDGVTECHRIDGEGQPDISLRWKGSAPILVECKNALRDTTKAGYPRVDFQRTRAPKGNPEGRYYQSEDFDVLAVCLHPVSGDWKLFAYRRTADLPEHPKHPGRIYNNLNTGGWVADPAEVFDAVVEYRGR